MRSCEKSVSKHPGMRTYKIIELKISQNEQLQKHGGTPLLSTPMRLSSLHLAIAIAGLRGAVLASGFSQAAHGASVGVEAGFSPAYPNALRPKPCRPEGRRYLAKDILSRGRQ